MPTIGGLTGNKYPSGRPGRACLRRAPTGVGAGPSANSPYSRLRRRRGVPQARPSLASRWACLRNPLRALVPDHRQTVPTAACNGVGACHRPALPWPPRGPLVNLLYYTPAAEKNPQFCYIPYSVLITFSLVFPWISFSKATEGREHSLGASFPPLWPGKGPGCRWPAGGAGTGPMFC